jgi:FecR protein
MTRNSFFRDIFSFLVFGLLVGLQPAAADSSHARVIRLSLVQGDVRFTREAHGDPLADQKATWEVAQANLPIRQGYVVATDNGGRAEVEFENGAMAFLNENTVLEFYDLSLEDGARTTRLVLRQGSASFYVNLSASDYFSVTGGDFTVEGNGKGSFRVNNFDDGSNVEVLTGRISVLHKKDSTPLSKGQSLSMKAGDDSVSIGRPPSDDEFDHWVAGRIDTVSSATNATLQYTSSPNYVPGFADLYTYGAWSSCGGYGYGWRPFGAGFGWSPFASGQWFWDASFGWTFLSGQPWGWAPYHYGGWLFDASCGGWFYAPPLYYQNYGRVPTKRFPPIVHVPRPLYRASTAVFVRQNGKLGVVPMHPLDKEGKTPMNLEHGVFSTERGNGRTAGILSATGTQKWDTLKSPPREALSNGLVPTTAPARTSRTILQGGGGTRIAAINHDTSIVYDPRERRFVNANSAARTGSESPTGKNATGAIKNNNLAEATRNGAPPVTTARVPATPGSARSSAPPSRNMAPPPAPRASGGGMEYSGGGGSSRGSSAAASHASSAPSSSSGGGGGRPH